MEQNEIQLTEFELEMRLADKTREIDNLEELIAEHLRGVRRPNDGLQVTVLQADLVGVDHLNSHVLEAGPVRIQTRR